MRGTTGGWRLSCESSDGKVRELGEGYQEGVIMSPLNNGTRARPLSDQVQRFMTRHDLTGRQFARYCIDPETGQSLLHGYIQDLMYGSVNRLPDMWRLRALAAGMAAVESGADQPDYRTRLEEIKRWAAVQWLELSEVEAIPVSDGGFVTISVPPNLSEEDRRRVIRMAERLAADLADPSAE
ncbi:hypothetical protein GCM10023259_023880 [Thermocatellispora tengchongensis]